MSNVIKDNSRKKHTEYARYNQDTEENISEEKGSVTKNKRGRPRIHKSPKRNQEQKTDEEGPSPKGKQKRVDFVNDDQREQSASHSPRRNKTEDGTDQKRKRSRNSSMSEFGDAVEPQSSRSARNRQPSRRLVESKMSEELVKEQLTNRKRVTVQRHEEHIAMEAFHEDGLPERHEHQVDLTDAKDDIPKHKRVIKKKTIKTEIDEASATFPDPTPQQNVSEQPKVFFKTVTQQPELPSEALYVGGKKQFAAASTTTKPVPPARTVAKAVGASAPVVMPRPTGVVRRVEKTRTALHLPAKIVSTTALSKALDKSSKAIVARLQKESKSAVFLESTVKNTVHETSDDQTVGAYHDLSQVASEEIVGEQELSSEPSANLTINHKEGRSSEIMDNIKIEPQFADDDDEAPPQLQAEKPTHEAFPRSQVFVENDGVVRCHSPGGNTQFVTVTRGADGSEMYIDENGEEVQMVDDVTEDLRTVEFNFLDSKNICCGLCGEIVPYDNLMSHHLPHHHPEVLGEAGGMNLEEVPYESWLKDKLYMEKKNMESGFRYDSAMASDDLFSMRMRGARPLRKVSQIRVNPIEMDIEQLNHALNKKMIEKMGRKVPVSLVDKQHAKCGICNAVVSLNKKFEIVHLVRHFNAWHPSAHRCAGNWQNRPIQPGCGKPLSIQDFAVIDVSMTAPDNLQCIWCGMFMDRNALAMHFTEVHPDEIEVPKCLLCMQELVINARLLEKYGEDFEVTLPDEHHVKCMKFAQTFSSESALDKAIAKRMQKINAATNSDAPPVEEDDEDEDGDRGGTVTNSRMTFGRRNKPKRSFVQPSLRQAIPTNSKYVEAVTECQWKCKLCQGNIFGAVISAGAIKHFKQYHPGEMENMQYELCKARLDRVSGGCMEFVHPQLVECLVCNLTYTLHKPYNMCRGIRHLKLKHPTMMPENCGGMDKTAIIDKVAANIRMGEIIDDPEMLARFKSEYQVDFDKVQAVYGEDNEPVYVLLGADETLDPRTASQMIQSLGEGNNDNSSAKRVVVGPRASMAAGAYDEEDVYGELAEDDELADMEASKPETSNRMNRVIASNDDTVVEEVVEEFIDVAKQTKQRQVVAHEEILETVDYQHEEAEGEEYYEYAQEVDYIDGEAEGQYMDAGYMEDEVEGEEYHDHDDAAQQQ